MKKNPILALAIGLALSACSPTNENVQSAQAAPKVIDYQAKGIIAKSLPEIVKALNSGEISSEALVTLYWIALKRSIDKAHICKRY